MDRNPTGPNPIIITRNGRRYLKGEDFPSPLRQAEVANSAESADTSTGLLNSNQYTHTILDSVNRFEATIDPTP